MNKIYLLFLSLCIVSIKSEASLNFLVLGDWGGDEKAPYTTPGELANAKMMEQLAGEKNTQFVLALGDNMYYHGVTDEHSSRFKNTWDDVFNGPNMQVPWYIVAGNHDHYGNAQAQLDFAKLNSRWNFPDYNYTFTKKVGSKTVQIIYFDSVQVCGGLDDEYSPFGKPVGPSNLQKADDQEKWVEQQLKDSKADYIWVGAHYPVYSGCTHGNTQHLHDWLKPLLEKYNAHYVCGHDHCQEHIYHNDVHYILTGTGHECCYPGHNVDKLPSGTLQWIQDSEHTYDSIGGFASFDVTESQMVVSFYNEKGSVLHQTQPIHPRNLDKTFLTE